MHCMDRTHFVYPLVHWRTFGFFHFWLLWITLQWIFLCKFFCGRLILFLLGLYLGVESLGHMVTLGFQLFEALPDCFPKWLHHFTFLPAVHVHFSFSITLPTFVIAIFLMNKILLVHSHAHLSDCSCKLQLQQQSRIVVTGTIWPAKLKVLSGPLQKKYTDTLLRALLLLQVSDTWARIWSATTRIRSQQVFSQHAEKQLWNPVLSMWGLSALVLSLCCPSATFVVLHVELNVS